MLTDLRESGDIEQDAYVVMLLHRDVYYTKGKENNFSQLIIAKSHDGNTIIFIITGCPSRHALKSLEFAELPSVPGKADEHFID